MKLCACGCGKPIKGKRNKRYYSTACRKAVSRLSRTRYQIQNPKGGIRRPGKPKTDTKPVTLPDTNFAESSVFCRGCGKVLPRLVGPSPVAAYCLDCVEQGHCPCSRRPAWHVKAHT